MGFQHLHFLCHRASACLVPVLDPLVSLAFAMFEARFAELLLEGAELLAMVRA